MMNIFIAAIAFQKLAAEAIEAMRTSMLPDLPPPEFYSSIPSEYKKTPLLQGRAVVSMVIRHGGVGKGAVYRLDDGVSVSPEINLKLVIDGYRAPLTGGNFIDLVDKHFYDGMTFQVSLNKSCPLTQQTLCVYAIHVQLFKHKYIHKRRILLIMLRVLPLLGERVNPSNW